MRWKSIFVWAALGIVVGAAIILGLVTQKSQELLLWGLAALVWGMAAARFAPGTPFRHGFLVGFLGGYVSCLLQSVFFETYLEHNPQVKSAHVELGRQFQMAPSLLRIAPAMSGFFVSGVYGCVVGTLATVAARVVRGYRAA